MTHLSPIRSHTHPSLRPHPSPPLPPPSRPFRDSLPPFRDPLPSVPRPPTFPPLRATPRPRRRRCSTAPRTPTQRSVPSSTQGPSTSRSASAVIMYAGLVRRLRPRTRLRVAGSGQRIGRVRRRGVFSACATSLGRRGDMSDVLPGTAAPESSRGACRVHLRRASTLPRSGDASTAGMGGVCGCQQQELRRHHRVIHHAWPPPAPVP